MKKVYEIVRYKQKKDVMDQAILKASKALQEIVKTQPGLISRKLSKSDSGEWMDVVLWESIDHATQAAEVVNTHPVSGEFMKLVDETTMVFDHYEIIEAY